MANYETEFMNALGQASSAIGGLLKDIREPDWEEKIRMETKLEQDSYLERMKMKDQYSKEQETHKADLAMDRMIKDYDLTYENLRKELNLRTGPMAKQWESFKSKLSVDAKKDVIQYEDLLNDENKLDNQRISREDMEFAKGIELQFAESMKKQNIKYKRGDLWGNLHRGYLPGGTYGSDLYDTRMGLWQGQQQYDQLSTQQIDFMFRSNDANNAINMLNNLQQANLISSSQVDSQSATINSLGSVLGQLDMSNPADALAAKSLLQMNMLGATARIRQQNIADQGAMDILGTGEALDLDPKRDVKIGKPERGGYFKIGPPSMESRKTHTLEARNSFSGVLGLATLQSAAAIRDKGQNINSDRIKESISDLKVAKNLLPGLMDYSEKAGDESTYAYYQESGKQIDNILSLLEN